MKEIKESIGVQRLMSVIESPKVGMVRLVQYYLCVLIVTKIKIKEDGGDDISELNISFVEKFMDLVEDYMLSAYGDKAADGIFYREELTKDARAIMSEIDDLAEMRKKIFPREESR